MPHSTANVHHTLVLVLGRRTSVPRVKNRLHCGSGLTRPTRRQAVFTSNVPCIFGRQSASASDICRGIVAAV